MLPSAPAPGRELQLAVELCEEIQSDELQSSVIMHKVIIRDCSNLRLKPRAVGLFAQKQSHGLQTDVITYGDSRGSERVQSRTLPPSALSRIKRAFSAIIC